MTYFGKYMDNRGEWRWRLYASNGAIIAVSGEGYVTEYGCDHAITTVRAAASSGVVRRVAA